MIQASQVVHGLCPVQCVSSNLQIAEKAMIYPDTFSDIEVNSKYRGHRFEKGIKEHYNIVPEGMSRLIRLIVGRHVLPTEAAFIKSSLVKQTNYFTRLFTNESWDEWLECRTSLGKVINIFCNFASQPLPDYIFPFMQQLNKELIEKADQEAHAVLRVLSLEPDAPNNMPEAFAEKCFEKEFHIRQADDHNVYSLASAGDLNGDGIPEILIGASYESPNGEYQGEVNVVWSKAGQVGSRSIDLSSP